MRSKNMLNQKCSKNAKKRLLCHLLSISNASAFIDRGDYVFILFFKVDSNYLRIKRITGLTIETSLQWDFKYRLSVEKLILLVDIYIMQTAILSLLLYFLKGLINKINILLIVSMVNDLKYGFIIYLNRAFFFYLMKGCNMV